MADELLKKFSNELKETRKSKKITLEQITSKTRIDIKFLRAIEDGDFTIIDQVYVRAFLKEYSQTLELDGDEILRKYDAAKAGKQEEVKTADDKVSAQNDKNQKKEFDATSVPAYTESQTNNTWELVLSDMQKKQLVYLGGGLAGVVILVLLFMWIFGSSSDQIIKESDYEDVLEEQSSRYEEETSTTRNIVSIQDSLTLGISASDTAWVMVTRDEIYSEDYTMYPGVSKEFKALQKFDLTVGNAGGITLSLDGNPLNFQGRIGQVRYLVIDETGLRVVTNTTTENNE